MHVFDFIVQVFAVGVIAYIYTNVLTDSGHILSWWKEWLEKVLLREKTHRARHQIPPSQKIPSKYKDMHWLFDPIVGCEKCVSGQMALWFYLIHNDWIWYEHILIILSTIYVMPLIKFIYTWFTHKNDSLS